MGGGKTNRGVDRDFPLSFEDRGDHGVEDDENGDQQGNDDVGHPGIIYGVAGIVEIDPIAFATEQGQTEPVTEQAGLAAVVDSGNLEGDSLEGPAKFHQGGCRQEQDVFGVEVMVAALEVTDILAGFKGIFFHLGHFQRGLGGEDDRSDKLPVQVRSLLEHFF